MNFKDPETMNAFVGNVLRYGVILSALVVLVGIVELLAAFGPSDSSSYLAYTSGSVPHGIFPVSLTSLVDGVVTFDPFSWIELGAIFLIATPVARVVVSVFLFATEKDKVYVVVTTIVLALLLFSMLATPFIPLFHA